MQHGKVTEQCKNNFYNNVLEGHVNIFKAFNKDSAVDETVGAEEVVMPKVPRNLVHSKEVEEVWQFEKNLTIFCPLG